VIEFSAGMQVTLQRLKEREPAVKQLASNLASSRATGLVLGRLCASLANGSLKPADLQSALLRYGFTLERATFWME